MEPEHRLLRLFVRASRPLPGWMRTRRAGVVAGFGLVAFIASIVADFAGFIDVITPGDDPVTPGELDEKFTDMKAWMLAQLGRPGAPVAAPVVTAIDKALSFYQSLKDPRVVDAIELMQNAPPHQALQMFEQVTLDYVPDKEPADAAKAWSAYGALALPVDGVVALGAYERANTLDPDVAYTHFQLGSLYQDFARLDDAKEANDRAIELARKEGDLTTAALALMHNGLVSKQRFQLDDAEAALTKAADEFQKLGDDYNRALVYLNLGSLYNEESGAAPFDANNLTPSEDYFGAALSIGYDLRDPKLVADANTSLADIWFRRGNHFLAVELYSRALGYYEWTNELERMGQARISLGLVALSLHDIERAKSDFSTALQIFSDLQMPLQIAATRAQFAIAYAIERDFDRACREMTDARTMLEEAGITDIAAIDELSNSVCYPPTIPEAPMNEPLRADIGETADLAGASQSLGVFDLFQELPAQEATIDFEELFGDNATTAESKNQQ